MKSILHRLRCFVTGHKSTSNLAGWYMCDRCPGEAPDHVVKGDYVGANRLTVWRGTK